MNKNPIINYLCKSTIYSRMGRILSIDYGNKRVGLAVTDPLKMIATRLTTVSAEEIWTFLSGYFVREEVELILVGYPRKLNNEPSEAIRYINPFLKKFRQVYPTMPVQLMDERFTSKLAFQTMIDAGVKKKDRQNKATIDGVSATIILQSYLEEQKYLM
jgi:putative Holliday junction resolvase